MNNSTQNLRDDLLVKPLNYYGLTEDLLQDVIVRGIAASNMATDNHPVTTAGTFGYHERVKALRDLLGPHLWTRCSKKNIESVVCPNERIAIVTSSAEGNVGREGGTVTTSYAKGAAYLPILEDNRQQNLPHVFDEPLPEQDKESGQNVATWFLLTCTQGDMVYCELSLPVEIEPNGYIQNWKERILLAPVPKNPDPNIVPANDEPDIDVLVSKKAI